MPAPKFPSRVTRVLERVKAPTASDGNPANPLAEYVDKDYVPAQDDVSVREMTAEQVDKAAGREMTEAQREGVAIRAALARRDYQQQAAVYDEYQRLERERKLALDEYARKLNGR